MELEEGHVQDCIQQKEHCGEPISALYFRFFLWKTLGSAIFSLLIRMDRLFVGTTGRYGMFSFDLEA